MAALIDWLDSGDEVYSQEGAVGAESSYYLGLDPPYQARNGKMLFLDGTCPGQGIQPRGY